MARIRAQTIGGGLGITPTSVAFYDVLSAGGTIAQMAVGGGLTGTWALINSSSSLVALSAGGLMTRGAGAATSGTPVVQFTSGSTILQVPITATVIVATLPANTVLPAISPSGTPVVGVTLTATTGTWTGDPTPTYAYQWRQVDTSTNISGATNPTYTPVSGDVGHTLTCVVTATNIKGSASASAATTPAVISVPVAPVNTVAPGAPTGSATVGGTLTAQNGTWTGNPTPTFTYAWFVNGVANGATGSTYVPVSGDLGSVISVRVTGTNVAGPASVTSAATAAIGSTPVAPSNTVAPVISGNPWPASTLTVSNGTWAGNPAPTFTYQWKSGGTNISGATNQTYVPLVADVGAVITCAVTGSNGVGSPATATSNSKTIITVPLITATPAAASLYAAVGDSITSGGVSSTVAYGDLFAGTDTTDITYFNKGQPGSDLAYQVGQGSTVDALIASNPGKATYVLTSLIGANEPLSSPSYYPDHPELFASDYAAYLDARKAAGWDVIVCTILSRNSFDTWIQQANSYIRGFVAAGHANALIDLYNDPVMGGSAYTSNTTLCLDGVHPSQTGQNYMERAIAPTVSSHMHLPTVVPTVISAPTITGTPTVGATLTAHHGSWNAAPTSYALQWKWADTNAAISGATGSTYTPVTGDIGHTIAVTEIASNGIGASSASTSSATAAVIAASTTTFDAANKAATVTLSNGNLTATKDASGGGGGVRATPSASTGKKFYSFVPSNRSTYLMAGVCNASYGMGETAGLSSANAAVYWCNTGIFISGTQVSAGVVSAANGAVVDIAVDVGAKLMWFRVNGGGWVGSSSTSDPATGTAGVDISAVTGALYPLAALYDASSSVAANFGGGAYTYAPPSGFSNW